MIFRKEKTYKLISASGLFALKRSDNRYFNFRAITNSQPYWLEKNNPWWLYACWDTESTVKSTYEKWSCE